MAFLATCLASVNLFAQANANIIINGYEAHPTRILAKFKKGVANQGKSSVLGKTGLKVVYSSTAVPGLVSLDVAGGSTTKGTAGDVAALSAKIDELTASGLFEYVQPNYAKHHTAAPTDGFFVNGSLWGLQNTGVGGGVPGVDISATNAWDITTGSEEIVVAVIDTGVRYDHVDLVNRMWINPGESGLDDQGNPKETNGLDDDSDGYVDNVHGINAVTGTGNPMDIEGHGTHVAGTIGAEANGAGPHVGVAWNVRIMALKFLDIGGGFTEDAIECLDFAISKGVKISNNSWGGGPFEPALFASIQAARSANHLFIASAGNEGSDNDRLIRYPSGYEVDNILTVAAIDRFNQLADFSNYGRTRVDVAAPGVDILSSWSQETNSYNTISGTSMAAPHVTGVAVLIAAAFPNATYGELRDRLMLSVDPVPALVGRTVTGGRVNAYRALTAGSDGLLEVAVTPEDESLVVRGTNEVIYVSVRDTFPISGATVTGISDRSTGLITFADDGVAPDDIADDGIYTAQVANPVSGDTISYTITAESTGRPPVTRTVTYTLIDFPPNDDFERAIKLPGTGARVATVNTYATIQDGEPAHAGVNSRSRSLWWNWTPTSSGRVLVDTVRSSFDTVLAVYTGNGLGNLTQVAAVDNVANTDQGHLFFDAVAGRTYRIVVAGARNSEFGTIRLNLAPNGQIDSSLPVVAITAPANGRIFTNSNITLSGTATDPQPNASGIKEVRVRINGSGNVILAEGKTSWSLPVTLAPGVTRFEVTAVDYAGLVSAQRSISVSYLKLGPVNDVFVKATPLEGSAGSVSGDSAEATKEKGEPDHAENQGGRSLWWSFAAAEDGVLTLDTDGSNFDTVLAAYTGTSVTNLAEVASNDDALPGSGYSKLAFTVRSGQVYRIAVDGFAGTAGNVALAYAFTATNLFDVTVSVNGEGSVTPNGGSFEAGSTVVLTAEATPYSQFVGWTGDVDTTDNPLSIVLTADTAVTAVFTPRLATDDFETGNFSKIAWVNGLNSTPWVIRSDSSARGQFSASSGIIPNNGRSVLSLTVNLRAGLASFDYRVSSEEGWDFLEFYVNGVRQDRWSGETQWSSYVFPTTAGVNTLEWHYVKDSSNKMGADAGFIDNVDLPLGLLLGGGAALSINPASVDGGVAIRLNGESGQTYIIQASSDLVNWTSISTNTAVNGVINFVDQDAGNDSARFYRAVLP